MQEELKKLFKNPKVQLALFTLLSVIIAIGLFGNPNIPGTQTVASTPTAGAGASGAAAGASSAAGAAAQVAAASSNFFIATLSPMAAGFALIPFIISILGIGISWRGISKQKKEKKTQKAIKRYKLIDEEKSRLNSKYDEGYLGLTALTKAGIALSDPTNSGDLNKIKDFINDDNKKLSDKTADVSNKGETYKELFNSYDAGEIVINLQKIRAEIKAYEAVETIDLRGGMSDRLYFWSGVETEAKTQMTSNNIASQGVKVRVVRKLDGAKTLQTQQH